MNLIEQFDNSQDQTIKTFNSIFKHNPILGFSDDCTVEIGPITRGGNRLIIINEHIKIPLDLTVKEKRACIERKKVSKKTNIVKTNKEKIKLSKLYKLLTPSQFMIYSAIRECKEVDGIEELSRNISLSNKTILLNLKPLVKLGLVKKVFSVSDQGSFFKLIVDSNLNID